MSRRRPRTGPPSCSRERVWHIPRPVPRPSRLIRAVQLIRAASRPLIVAGGGVIYSEACEALRFLAEAAASRWPRPRPARARPLRPPARARARIGSTGTAAANQMAARPTSSSASAPGTATSPPLPGRRSGNRRCASSTSTSRPRTRPSRPACPWSPTPGPPCATWSGPWAAGPPGRLPGRREAVRPLAGHGRGRLYPRPPASSRAVRGHRGGQRGTAERRRGGLRRRVHAG